VWGLVKEAETNSHQYFFFQKKSLFWSKYWGTIMGFCCIFFHQYHQGTKQGSFEVLTIVMGAGGSRFGSGWVSHLWFEFEFGKFPLKMSQFTIFSLQVRSKSTWVKGGSASYLLRVKWKLGSGWVRAHHYFWGLNGFLKWWKIHEMSNNIGNLQLSFSHQKKWKGTFLFSVRV